MIYPITESLAILARPRGPEGIHRVQVLVSMLTDQETTGPGRGSPLVQHDGRQVRSLSHPDRGLPAPDLARELAELLAEEIRAGNAVGVHCRAGVGRSAVLAAQVLVQLGSSPEEALQQIGRARGCSVPDTEEQLRYVLSLRPPGGFHGLDEALRSLS
ncbi:MAG: hypothetical protein AB1758_37395 [Candidatus Eremiobacterota bacterium]